MNQHRLLCAAGLGALSVLAAAAAEAVDTSQWTCQACPFEKGASGTVEIGGGGTSDRPSTSGDYTGLQRHRSFLVLGGTLRQRGDDGSFVDAAASDLGLDSRSLSAVVGREGLYRAWLGYDELPRRYTDGASTPFLGVGSNVLTLPAGYPAGTTATMPLATTLQPVDIGLRRSRLDLGTRWQVGDAWALRLDARRDVRDGTQVGAGSFFATTSQLPVPVDQTTHRFEVRGSYSGQRLQASASYQASIFQNASDGLTWQNPFNAVVPGATRGQLALAPDNQFHQLAMNLGYEVASGVRASADLAVGRMTQDAPFLPLTATPGLAKPLPATSLHGRVSTIDADLRLDATLTEQLRLSASLGHHRRENDTPVAVYPGVAADVFATEPAANRPYGTTQDRGRLQFDLRLGRQLRGSAGVDHEQIERTLLAVGTTRETRVWARVASQVSSMLGLALKVSRADRHGSYGDTVSADTTAQNPLQRSFNLADRVRDSLGLRADLAINEKVSLGFDGELAFDDYNGTSLGLVQGRYVAMGADVSAALTEQTSLYAFVRGERVRTLQAGSQNFALPDWTGRMRDLVDLTGVGVRHQALGSRLDVAGELFLTRSRSQVTVNPGSATPPFPAARTPRDTLQLRASYQWQPAWTLVGRYGYERRTGEDWRYDGLLPASVPNLLAFGTTTPQHEVHALQVSVRYAY